MSGQNCFKYLVSSDSDELWGITVDSVGECSVEAGYEIYPPVVGHPEYYYFDIRKGRILYNYLLLYISGGKGWYHTSSKERIGIEAGNMILVPPYTWHSYYPDKKSGWQEHWIALHGHHIDERFRNGFFDRSVVYKIGFRDQIIDLYKEAIDIALKERPGHQQVLAAIGNSILAHVIYYEHNGVSLSNTVAARIDRARSIIHENVHADIDAKEIAQAVNMSYSWFRKVFKKYTNVSPSQYIAQLKMQKAKSLLLNSPMSVKEIAFYLNYGDTSYFSALFRKSLGCSPSEYREKALGVEK